MFLPTLETDPVTARWAVVRRTAVARTAVWYPDRLAALEAFAEVLTGPRCRACGAVIWEPHFIRLAQTLIGLGLCHQCWRASVEDDRGTTA